MARAGKYSRVLLSQEVFTGSLADKTLKYFTNFASDKTLADTPTLVLLKGTGHYLNCSQITLAETFKSFKLISKQANMRVSHRTLKV